MAPLPRLDDEGSEISNDLAPIAQPPVNWCRPVLEFGVCKHSQVVAGQVEDLSDRYRGGGLIMAKPGVGKYSEIKGTKSGHLSRQEEDRGCMMKNMMKRSTCPEQLHRAWAQEPARPIAGHEKWSLVYRSLGPGGPEPVLSSVRLGPTA